MSDDGSVLTTYTVYFQPLDFPEHWVVRRFHLRMAEDGAHIEREPVACLYDSYVAAAGDLPPGLVRFIDPNDAPTIFETWM